MGERTQPAIFPPAAGTRSRLKLHTGAWPASDRRGQQAPRKRRPPEARGRRPLEGAATAAPLCCSGRISLLSFASSASLR